MSRFAAESRDNLEELSLNLEYEALGVAVEDVDDERRDEGWRIVSDSLVGFDIAIQNPPR